ncbi:esterase FrsA [Saccharopolyspora sp. 6T]|uniref:alpha/beta hydrolase n=1 Tax=Saccharopolyspora sp. 6T TaxID=2877238 RepID=UPI001CD2D012|nr:alpha/beta hydrolase [Saccharopolyspora sp. 6T]MCA1185187.1 esterase FrsA [Saccharopolyspora sp. 6T]
MFTFPVEPADLFTERARNFRSWGVPTAVIARVRHRVDDVWGRGRTGWVPVWAEEARRAEIEQDWARAAACWGAARFPCLATADRREAYARQLDCFRHATANLPVAFRRYQLDVPYRQRSTRVTAHVYRRRRGVSDQLLLLCGGVDTWKVELHRMALRISLVSGLTVAAVDMPGTGESRVPLAADADLLLAGTARQLADRTRCAKTAVLGLSFGGHWAAKLALTGRVDAAIDLGGPIGACGSAVDVLGLPHGMAGSVGNALHLAELPGRAEADRFSLEFSLRRQGLLSTRSAAPLLAINGTGDPYVPLRDTIALADRPEAEVWLVPGTGHCARERLPRVLPPAIAWLLAELSPRSVRRQLAARALRTSLGDAVTGPAHVTGTDGHVETISARTRRPHRATGPGAA